jgi:REP element-mobilizing transposase RayT
MPRKPRIDIAGGIHHVWARGNRRGAIFIDDDDRLAYLELLGWVVGREAWDCIAYCLMTNHVHLLVETPKPTLARGMQVLHGDYARDFNDAHGQDGHVFQGRYGSKLVDDDEQLVAAAGYIALNPVEARLCAGAQEWRWSSYSALAIGAAPPWLRPDRLFAVLAAAGGDPRRRYAELVGS